MVTKMNIGGFLAAFFVDHRFRANIGEQRDLAPLVGRNFAVGAAQQNIGLDADFAQLLHRMLGRLGFQLACGRDVGQQGQMDETGVFRTVLKAHLADGLQKRQRFDIAHGAADFHQRHIGTLGARTNRALDLVGDVRDDLHRAPEVIATTLLVDHRFVDLAGGEVVAPTHPRAGKALVMAQIEVGFRTVVGHEHLAVLERTHGAGIDVDVGIEL